MVRPFVFRLRQLGSSYLAPLLASLFLAVACLNLPRLPVTRDGDCAWTAVLSYAHEHGLQFGKDIVYTYGPAGFLITYRFTTQDAGLRLVVNASLCWLIAAGVCLLAWRLKVLWRGLLLALFVVVAANLEPRFDFLFEAGLLCWGLLCLVESGRLLPVFAGGFTGLAVFGALAKVSFLFMAGLSVLVMAGDLCLRRKPRLGLLVGAGFGVGFILGWLALGQQWGYLWPFLTNAVNVVLGYETMASEGLPMVQQWGAVVAGLAFGMVTLGTLAGFAGGETNGRARRLLLWTWMAALLFMVWKHGFVMVEPRHVVFFFGFVLALVPALEALPGGPRTTRLWARALGMAAGLLILVLSPNLLFSRGLGPLSQPFDNFRDNLQSLLWPREYIGGRRDLQAAQLGDFHMPRLAQLIGDSRVDVYGLHQSYALFNNLRYQPRPVFQSFVAYNRPLMRLNEAFYRSPAAPKFVLFELEPIQHRLPSLEDGWLFRDLLLNYEPIAMEHPFLLLRSRACQEPRLTPLGEGTVRPGEPIDLRSYGNADLWMEIRLEPTWAGRLRQFFFQPSKLRLAVWREPGQGRIARPPAPALMLAAGFVASPWLHNKDDVLDLYTGNRVTRPGAYSVEVTPGEDWFWRKEIHFRVYKIENQLGRCAPTELAWRLRYPGFEAPPIENVAPNQQVVTIGDQPALQLPAGGCLRLALPAGTKTVSGSCGLGRDAYRSGGTIDEVEFRIEEEMADGTTRLLGAEIVRPAEASAQPQLRHFSVAVPGDGERKVVLKAVARPPNPLYGPICWAAIRFGRH